MIEPEDRLERFMLWVVTRFPPRAVAAIVAGFYPGIGLILPWLLGLPPLAFVSANLFGVVVAGTLVIMWLAVQIQARDRRHLLDWTADIRQLDAQEFEWFVGEIYRRDGWKVEFHGRQDTADGNIDLVLTRPGDRRLAQCKKWSVAQIGIDEIRKFAGTLTREKLPVTAGTFVTSSRFNQHAVAEAKSLGLELVDGPDLHRKAEAVRKTELCENGHPMILDHSVHGWWFRCLVEGCKGKRHLDKDAGRAIAMLTEPHG